jgi:CTP:molybdopterin cytidylyltransferase MocA
MTAVDKAVILAAGRGTRMQQAHDSAGLNAGQSAAARSGLKAMMPVSRPFIDYVLSGLADAGYRRVCLVIGLIMRPCESMLAPVMEGGLTSSLRFSTSHWGPKRGSVWAVVDSADARELLEEWRARYANEFPTQSEQAEFFLTQAGIAALTLSD